MRLDKYLHDTGYGSRKEIRRAVAKGRVMVGGEVTRDPGAQLVPEMEVTFDGELVVYQKYHTLMLHKPAGFVSARKDPVLKTVLDLLPDHFHRLKMAPVGRLDVDTTGLLLVTNDGQLSHRLTSPKYGVAKVYIFTYTGDLVADAVERVEEGLELGDFVALPASLSFLGPGLGRLVLQEGKYHQVKRMVAALGGQVSQLKRVAFGPLSLPDDLAPGDWRYLTEEESQALEGLGEKEASR